MLSVQDMLPRARRLFGAKLAVIDGDYQASYEEMCGRVEALAGALRGLGLKPGDRLAVMAPNSHEYLETYYACAQTSIVIMPLNIRLSPNERERSVPASCRAPGDGRRRPGRAMGRDGQGDRAVAKRPDGDRGRHRLILPRAHRQLQGAKERDVRDGAAPQDGDWQDREGGAARALLGGPAAQDMNRGTRDEPALIP